MRFDLWATERERAEVKPNGVRVLVGDNPPTVKIWQPKAVKPAANYRFRSTEQRDSYIERYLHGVDEHKAAVVERRKAHHGTPEQLAQVQTGAIFVYSWGYEQTNVDYLQVIEVKGGGTTVVVRPIAGHLLPDRAVGPMAGYTMPERDRFLQGEQPLTKRVRFNSSGPFLNMDYSIAQLFDGTPNYRSWYG